MYAHSVLQGFQLLKEVLCGKAAITLLLGILGVLLVRKSLMEQRGDDSSEAMLCCASCGIAEVDDIKLKECDDCDLVNYCCDECKEEHRSQHEAKCKERAAELRDESLFKQSENCYMGDCPICCLPLPIDFSKSMLQSCCCKFICEGCWYADKARQRKETIMTCPFYRHGIPETKKYIDKNLMKRAAANDPTAFMKLGNDLCDKGNHDGAFKYWIKAAELGDAVAHCHLSIMYRKGQGVEKDETKEVYHLEEAAIQGHPDARYRWAPTSCLNLQTSR